jgi:hypothetical protein
MLRTLFIFVVISLISFSGYSNPISSTKNDSVVVQRNNGGTLAEGAAEDVFEFLDLKENYCGIGPHSIKFRSKINITKESYVTIRLILPNGDESFYISGLTYKGNATVEAKFSLYTYSDITEGKSIKFVIKGETYRSESKPFSLIMSFIKPQTTSHCEDHTSTINFAGKIPYDSISWSYNDSTIKNETKNSIKVSETGLYRATINYKACSATSLPHFIQKGVIPEIYLDYANGSSICKTGSVPIFAKQSLWAENFPYSGYQWELDGKVIETSKERTFNAKKPGNYTLTAFQGKCKVVTKAIKVSQNSFQFNTIEFLDADSITTNNKYVVCKGQKVDLRLKSFKNEKWQNSDDDKLIDTLLHSQGFKFQWIRDGIEIPGANKLSYTTDQPGRYILQIENGLCISNSNPLELTNSDIIPMKLRTYRKDDCVYKSIGIYYKVPLNYNIDLSVAEVRLFRDGSEQLKSKEVGNNLYVDESGYYHVQVKINNSCSVLSDTISLKFHQTPPKMRVDTIYSCSDIVDLSNPSAYYGSKCEWTLNGEKLAFNGLSIKVDKPGLYSTTLSQECGPVFYFFVVLKKMKVTLDLFQESLTTCSERSTILRVFVSPYNKFPVYPSENPTKPYVKLYRNNNAVDEGIAKYQNAYDYSSFNFGYMAEFEIGESGTYNAVMDEPGCQTVSNNLKIDFKKIEIKTNPEISSERVETDRIKIVETIGDKYQWYFNEKPINVHTSEIKIKESGIYFAKVGRGDCVTFTDKFNVFYNTERPPKAILRGDTLVSAGTAVNLKLNFEGTPPFWYKLNNNQEGNTMNLSHVHRITVDTSFTFRLLSVKNNFGEGTVSGSSEVKVKPKVDINVLANEPSIGQHIRVFPVPTTGIVEIEFDQLNRHGLSYQLFNQSGQVIISDTRVVQPKQKLDFNTLSPGIYFIRMQVGKEIVMRKIVKQ